MSSFCSSYTDIDICVGILAQVFGHSPGVKRSMQVSGCMDVSAGVQKQ